VIDDFYFWSPKLKTPQVSDDVALHLRAILGNKSILKRSDPRKDVVKVIQQCLIDVGHPLTQIMSGATGFFGGETESAVRGLMAYYRNKQKHPGWVDGKVLEVLDRTLYDPFLYHWSSHYPFGD
jgi:hypothetical protein